MDNMPLVSVCMPAYNAEKYIIAAIESVLGQTYPNIELIVMNDGSTDGTAAELEKITDSRLKVLHQPNKGQCAAANAAFRASTGDLIKFMDADDLISPGFIAAQVSRLGGRTDAVASAAWGRFYDDDLTTFSLRRDKTWRDLPATEWLVQSWGDGSSMMQCALWLIPREVLAKSGLWDESLNLINDLDFFTRVLLSVGDVLFAGDAVLYYRSGISGSLSDTKSDAALDSAFRSMDSALRNLLAAANTPQTRLACANMWQNFIYMLYPRQPAMIEYAERHIKDWGGANIPFPAGGITRALLPFLGWKLIKRVKKTYFDFRKA